MFLLRVGKFQDFKYAIQAFLELDSILLISEGHVDVGYLGFLLEM